MEFILKRNSWWGALLTDKCPKNAIIGKLDTGAVATRVGIDAVALLKGVDKKYLKEYLSDKGTVVFTGIAGVRVKHVPCHISNVQVCDTVIKDFYCMVPLDDSNLTLVGADLISSCMVKGIKNDSMLLAGLDEKLYKKNFISVCNSVNPTELLDMSVNELCLLSSAQKSRQCLQYKSKFNLTDGEFDKEILRILYKNNISSIDMLEYIIQHESPIGRDPMWNK